MSQLPVSMRDHVCAEIHQRYLAHKNLQIQRPPTPFQGDPATLTTVTLARLPPIESENDGVNGRSCKRSRQSKPDLSLLRFRFSENLSGFRSSKEFVGLDPAGTSHSKKSKSLQLSSSTEANPSFVSRKLQMIKNQNYLSDNDLVKKWSKHPVTFPSGKSQQNYGTNEVLSIAIKNFGQGTIVSRKRGRSKCVQTSLPHIPLEAPGEEHFTTRFKPIKVKDDQVAIARERREFHNYGLYMNPQPFDHRGVSNLKKII